MSSPLGELIRQQRVSRGLSPEKLAGLSGVSRNMIVAVERGGNVSVETLEKLAIALALDELPLGNSRLVARTDSGLNVARLRALTERLVATSGELLMELGRPNTSGDAPITYPGGIEGVDFVDEGRRPRAAAATAENDFLAPPAGATIRPDAFPFRPPQPHMNTDEWIDVVIDGRVAAGPPIDYEAVETARVPPEQAPAAGWKVLEAWGDSMIEFGIYAGDLIYVEPRPGGVAATGETIIGWLNDGLVVKKWERRKRRRFLHSGNDAYPPREITADDVWELRAIVRQVVQRKPRTIEFPNISGKNGKNHA